MEPPAGARALPGGEGLRGRGRHLADRGRARARRSSPSRSSRIHSSIRTCGDARPGDRVNLEADVDRQVRGAAAPLALKPRGAPTDEEDQCRSARIPRSDRRTSAPGRMVVVVDDEDRENEGDLTIAAEKVTPDVINFMARHGRGLICLPMTGERLDELRIPLMVRDEQNDAQVRHRVLRAHRGQAGHHHRHLRRATARAPCWPPSTRGRSPATWPGPATCSRCARWPGGVLRARGPDRGGGGPRAPGRPLSRRASSARSWTRTGPWPAGRASRQFCRAHGLKHDHHQGPHPAPHAARAAGAQDRRGQPAHRLRRLPHPRLREPDRRPAPRGAGAWARSSPRTRCWCACTRSA